jgi:hypothetical protein
VSYVKIVLLALQLVNWIIDQLERRKQLAEGERRQIAKALAQVTIAGKMAKEVDDEVKALSDDEVDAALRGDFRD